MSTRATGVVGIAVLCSRILGLIREQVFAGLFGAGKNLDAFLIAFRVPNLLRDLFAEGALSTAFITTFSRKIATEGDESAWRLGNKVATLTAIFMSAVTLLGIIFAPQIIYVMTGFGGWSPDKTATTILLTRIMWPFILLVSLAALVMGMLNAKNIFGPPAMASSYFNLGSIIGGVALGYWLDPHFGTRSLIGLSIGTLIGGLWQLTAQFPSLRRVGYKYHSDFHWRDPGVRTVLTLMAPAVIAASAVQVNVLVNSAFAARVTDAAGHVIDGPVSWLNIAFRLMQLPLGIFGVAVGTVTLPLVSRTAAVGDMAGFRSALAHAIRLVTLLTIPAAVGLILLAEPIIAVIYQHGRFTAESTRQTAAALQFYAIGLAAYSAVKVLAPAFYALDKRYLPMVVSILSIAINFVLNWFFMFKLGLGHRGLALAVSLVAIINFTLLYIMMQKHAGSLETGAFFGLLAKLIIPLALMAGVCWLSLDTMFYPGAHLPGWQRVFGVLLVIGVAAAVFFGSAFLFRVDEVRDVVNLVRRKLGGARLPQPPAGD
ncbi:MAG TPA: murein biosynthesis integral membrane protein MurJ [Chthoniobacterales bacterium]|nr:murein biosynthesis integral membrane protein MurJ [Chthoniobacterales bacterium]